MESVLFPVDIPATNTPLVICSVVRSVGSDSIWMANIVRIVCIDVNMIFYFQAVVL